MRFRFARQTKRRPGKRKLWGGSARNRKPYRPSEAISFCLPEISPTTRDFRRGKYKP